MRYLLLALSLVFLAGVTPGGEEKPRRDRALEDAITPIRVAREADSVVVARMKEIHRSPGVWCGIVATRQQVTYEVVEHLYGARAPETVRIGHLLVSGSGTVLKDTPHLRWDKFHPGARAILCLRRDEDQWRPVGDDFGVILVDPPLAPDPEIRAIVRRTLAVEALRPYLHPDRPGRVPVAVAISKATPVPLDFEMFGRPVRFAHPEALEKAPHFVITEIERDGDKVGVRFRYDVEGVAGDVDLLRTADGWRVTRSTITER